jgi:hypothetical protein
MDIDLGRIIITLFLLLTGAQIPSGAPPVDVPQEAGETFRSPTIIDNVDALILESFPAQIHLAVTGSQSDGCDYPVQVEQRRDGNTITVEIFREVPLAVMCPMVLLPYEDTIPLEGTFESGTYTINVNNYTLEVTI